MDLATQDTLAPPVGCDMIASRLGCLPWYYPRSVPPGWKIRVGDLRPSVTQGNLWEKLWYDFQRTAEAHPEFPGTEPIWHDIRQITVKSGQSDSGASYATITTGTRAAAWACAYACWQWGSGVHLDSEGNPTRFCTVKWLLPRPEDTQPVRRPDTFAPPAQEYSGAWATYVPDPALVARTFGPRPYQQGTPVGPYPIDAGSSHWQGNRRGAAQSSLGMDSRTVGRYSDPPGHEAPRAPPRRPQAGP